MSLFELFMARAINKCNSDNHQDEDDNTEITEDEAES